MRHGIAASCLFACSCAAAQAGSIVSAGESLDFTFGVASASGAIGVSTVQLSFDPSQPQLLTNPGGYGLFGNLRFDYLEVDHGGGQHTVSIVISTLSAYGFMPPGLAIGGQPVDTMFFDFGDFFHGASFSDGIDPASPLTVQSTNYGYFIDGALAAGPFSIDGFENGDLVGQAAISTNNGSDIGQFGINGFRIDWDVQLSATAVPLPTGGGLAGVGLLGLACLRRRR